MRKLIKKILKESDDLDWVKDVKPRLPLRVGTCLTFKHSKEEEEWVEDEYGNMIDHGKMNWHITSKFIDVYNDDKPTFSMVATDRMGESRQIFMEVEKVKELYEEGVYEPCKKQPYLKRVMKEELRHIGNEDEWDFNRIKLNTRLILPHTGVILKIVGFNPKYDTLKICGDFGCSKISIQNLQALIKDGTYKILKESDDLDWIRGVEPRLTKGLILCPNHEKFIGGCKEVIKVDKVLGSTSLVYLKDLETGNRYANTIKDMMQWLSDGEYIVNNG